MVTKNEWLAFRYQWLKDNPPDHDGYYICGICGKPVWVGDVTLDHILPRSSHPELILDVSNIQPAHGKCNSDKGSRKIVPKVSKAEYELLKYLEGGNPPGDEYGHNKPSAK